MDAHCLNQDCQHVRIALSGEREAQHEEGWDGDIEKVRAYDPRLTGEPPSALKVTVTVSAQ